MDDLSLIIALKTRLLPTNSENRHKVQWTCGECVQKQDTWIIHSHFYLLLLFVYLLFFLSISLIQTDKTCEKIHFIFKSISFFFTDFLYCGSP